MNSLFRAVLPISLGVVHASMLYDCVGVISPGLPLVINSNRVELEPTSFKPLFVKAELVQEGGPDDENDFRIRIKSVTTDDYIDVANWGISDLGELPGLWIQEGFGARFGYWDKCNIGSLRRGVVVIIEMTDTYTKATMINPKSSQNCVVDTRVNRAIDRRRLNAGFNDILSGSEDVIVEFGGDGVTKWDSIEVCKGVETEA